MLHTHWELVVDLNLGLRQKVLSLLGTLMVSRQKEKRSMANHILAPEASVWT